MKERAERAGWPVSLVLIPQMVDGEPYIASEIIAEGIKAALAGSTQM